jgi:hypothetical protein
MPSPWPTFASCFSMPLSFEEELRGEEAQEDPVSATRSLLATSDQSREVTPAPQHSKPANGASRRHHEQADRTRQITTNRVARAATRSRHFRQDP